MESLGLQAYAYVLSYNFERVNEANPVRAQVGAKQLLMGNRCSDPGESQLHLWNHTPGTPAPRSLTENTWTCKLPANTDELYISDPRRWSQTFGQTDTCPQKREKLCRHRYGGANALPDHELM